MAITIPDAPPWMRFRVHPRYVLSVMACTQIVGVVKANRFIGRTCAMYRNRKWTVAYLRPLALDSLMRGMNSLNRERGRMFSGWPVALAQGGDSCLPCGFAFACLLLLGMFALSTSALAANPVTTNSAGALVLTNHFGDLNDDGVVDVRDVVLLTRHLNGTQLLPTNLLARADLNQDGAITAADRAILADMIAARNTGPDDDFDGDELANAEEIRRGTSPFDPDTDRDGWLDGWEVAEGTDPLSALSCPKTFVIARPPVQVLSPLIQDTDTNTFGVVLARPPVQVLSPLIQDTDTNMFGVVLARPPVQVISPLIQDADTNTFGVVLARPPVQVISPARPEIEEAGATTLGCPPILIFFPALPQVEEAGATTLGHPPVTVTNPPPQ